VAGELILRFVPNAEQRLWRNMTRGTRQWTRDRVRLHHRVEWLLEDVQPSFEAALVDR
jgi:transposase